MIKFINQEVRGVANVCMPVLDVRDMAQGMLLCLTGEGISGKRIVLCQETINFMDYAVTLRDELLPHGYKIKTKKVGKAILKIASFIVPQIRAVLPRVDREFR